MLNQRVQRLGHMAVAQIPGRDSLTKHGAVILFGILYQPGVLFREEEFIGKGVAIAAGKVGSALAHLHPLVDDLILAALAQSKTGGVSVSLRILAKILEAGIAIAGAAGSFGVNLVQEIKDSPDGSMQTVKIQSIEAYTSRGLVQLVVIPQPANKVEHIGVAPHPGGKSLEASKGIDRILVFALKSYKLIDAIRIRPICFDRNRVETFFRNQALGNLCAQSIELMGAMRGFSNQNKTRVADHVEQRIEICRFSRQRLCRAADCVNDVEIALGSHCGLLLILP